MSCKVYIELIFDVVSFQLVLHLCSLESKILFIPLIALFWVQRTLFTGELQ